MIISRTPFRVSLAGGGSDLAEYYRRRRGTVVTMAINHYMYVTVHRRFDASIRVSYTRTELVEHIDDLQHNLVRECLRMTGFTRGIEVTTIADLPAGIGLGSSSSLTVGLLNGLYALKGEWHSAADLSRRACQIEIDILRIVERECRLERRQWRFAVVIRERLHDHRATFALECGSR